MRNNKTTGEIGEDIARKYLIKNGYTVITSNYARKCGELDIIAKRNGILCFVEVKAQDVNHETLKDEHRPEERVNSRKINKINRTIKYFLADHHLMDIEWYFMVVIVKLNRAINLAKVYSVYDGIGV
jgi:putative endonuclease